MSDFHEKFARIETEFPQSPHAQTMQRLKMQLKNRPLFLYGAGGLCDEAINVCRAESIHVAGICDGNKAGTYKHSGLAIISPAQLVSNYADAIVMITSWRYEKEIADDLMKKGFPQTQIYPFRPYSISVRKFKEDYFEGYLWMYDHLEDGASQKLVLDKVRSYLLDEPLTPNTPHKMYFGENIFPISEDEVFLDAGAFTGDTTKDFVEHTQGKYNHIWLFEPDVLKYEQVVRNLSQYLRTDVVPKGLWSHAAELPLYGIGESDSTFIPESERTIGFTFVSPNAKKQIVPVTSLDAFFDGKPDHLLPTFIKMDIEGAEKEALLGALNLIKRVRPKFAIAVEHKPQDIYDLPQLLHSVYQDYHFVLRQYHYSFTETILYAY